MTIFLILAFILNPFDRSNFSKILVSLSNSNVS